MSANSWCEEFYPIEADKACSRIDYECVEHALKKWTGALPENLEKHEVKYQDFKIIGINENSFKDSVFFDDTTCTLCFRYPKTRLDYDLTMQTKKRCVSNYGRTCPLNLCLGKQCDDVYHQSQNDPTPMIRALEKTLKMLEPQIMFK